MMKLTHIEDGRDYRGWQVPIYVFECEKEEKDTPKVAGFLFGLHGGISDPPYRWTTKDPNLARKLIQYADEYALAALQAAGVDLVKARANAVKREKALIRKEQNELANMSEETREREIQKWLAYAEKTAREKGYVGADCRTNLLKLRGFQSRKVEERFDAALDLARVVKARLHTPEKLNWIREWLPGNWHAKAAKAVQEAVLVLRQAGESALAKEYETELNRLNQWYRNPTPKRLACSPADFQLRRGSGTGARPFPRSGGLVRNTEANLAAGQPEWLFVLREGSRYYAQGGEEAGVGAARGYVYWIEARAATEREAAPAKAAWQEYQTWQAAFARGTASWQALAGKICREGAYPLGPIVLHGEVIEHPLVRPEWGDCFVVENSSIWHVQANPAEGAHKELNNVQLAGRAAVGHRVPKTQEMKVAFSCVVALLSTRKPSLPPEVDFNCQT